MSNEIFEYFSIKNVTPRILLRLHWGFSSFASLKEKKDLQEHNRLSIFLL